MDDYKELNDYEIIYMVRENDDDATNLLLEKYRPIILKFAKDYHKIGKRFGLEIDDFIQEGNYALFQAIKQYSDKKNSIFYTYAVICIKSKMQNLIVRNNAIKNYSLNYSVSLYQNIDDKLLIDYLKDSKGIDPNIEIENIELETEIKKMLYDFSFDDSIICELKLNGFTNKDIVKLLDKSMPTVYKAISKLKRNLMIVIEKCGL